MSFSNDSPSDKLFNYVTFLSSFERITGGYNIILRFLSKATRNWSLQRPLTVMDLLCGLGDLSVKIVEWARERGLSVRVYSVDSRERLVQLGMNKTRECKEICFCYSELEEGIMTKIQQFDFVVCSSGLHHFEIEEADRLLRIADSLSRHGMIFTDYLRDIRALYLMKALSKLWGTSDVHREACVPILRGFGSSELKKIVRKSRITDLKLKSHFGYRFSLSSCRSCDAVRPYNAVAGWAGAS